MFFLFAAPVAIAALTTSLIENPGRRFVLKYQRKNELQFSSRLASFLVFHEEFQYLIGFKNEYQCENINQ